MAEPNRKKLFQVAVLRHLPLTKKERDEGTTPDTEIVIPIKSVLARDAESATFLVNREIPEDLVNVRDQLEIIVRPL